MADPSVAHTPRRGLVPRLGAGAPRTIRALPASRRVHRKMRCADLLRKTTPLLLDGSRRLKRALIKRCRIRRVSFVAAPEGRQHSWLSCRPATPGPRSPAGGHQCPGNRSARASIDAAPERLAAITELSESRSRLAHRAGSTKLKSAAQSVWHGRLESRMACRTIRRSK